MFFFVSAQVPALIAEGASFRVDVQHDWLPVGRLMKALSSFTRLREEPTVLQALVVGSCFSTQERNTINNDEMVERYDMLDGIAANFHLNESQRQAIFMTLQFAVSLVQGPPGSGKTSVVSGVIAIHSAQAEDEERRGRPVVCATPSSAAADNAMLRHAITPGARVGRLGREATLSAEALPFSLARHARLEATNPPSRKRRRTAADQRSLPMTVVFGTLDSCSEVSDIAAPLVIIDEANQATEPASIIPFDQLDSLGHVVLVGDQHQLVPTVLATSAKEKGLGRSLFERLLVEGGCEVVHLKLQYRMKQLIWSWPNSVFYADGIGTAATAEGQAVVGGLPWRSPVAFVHVPGSEERVGTSYRNLLEAECAVNLVLGALASRTVRPDQVAIITPYAGQKKCLLQHMDGVRETFGVLVMDIGAFQGLERDFIVVSFTRSNTAGMTGIVDDKSMVNFMLTRARRGLAVLGNHATLSYCRASGLCWFMDFAHAEGVAYVYSKDGRFEPYPVNTLPPEAAAGHSRPPAPCTCKEAPATVRTAVPTVWSLRQRLQLSPGLTAVAGSLQDEARQLQCSLPFVVSLAAMLSLKQHELNIVDIEEALVTLLMLLISPQRVRSASDICILKLHTHAQIQHTQDIGPEQWDRKAWSRQNFFASEGVALDPGNEVLSAALLALVVLADALCSHFPKVDHGPCHLSPALVLESCLPMLLRYLLVVMQHNMPRLRYGVAGQCIDCEAAGDILEAVGGFLRPWAKRAEGVSRTLAEKYGFGPVEVDDALRNLTNFVGAVSFAFAHVGGDRSQFSVFLAQQFPHAFQAAVPQHCSFGACHPCSLCAAFHAVFAEHGSVARYGRRVQNSAA